MRVEEKAVAWKWAALWSLLLCGALLWVVADTLLGFGERDVRTVEIPDCQGARENELRFAPWMDVTVEYRYDDEIPAGEVIAQNPLAGERRKVSERSPTCELRLWVSLGKERVALPMLVGEDARAAEARLRELGLSVKLSEVASNAPAGSVIAMTPDGGTEIARGGTVVLSVSRADSTQTVRVPTLLGLSRAAALMEIWRSGLGVGDVNEVASDAPAGTVVRQSHVGGTLVTAGTRITLYVSQQD